MDPKTIIIDESQGTLAHVLYREALHAGLSTTILVYAFWGIRWLNGKLKPKYPWLGYNCKFQLLVAALVVFLAAAIREPIDIANGQPFWKSFLDWGTWFVMLGLGAIAIWHLIEIQE